ncbi:hypothetical protein M1307_03440 [Patescibacteria group bacterium]|nr:hypothetical protein [Patescibacteria group bacterium]
MTNPEGQRGSALVKGALVGVALAVAGSSAVCAIEASKGKGPQPTPTPIETPTVNPTATREVTPTPETINLPAVDISEKFLLNIHSRLADKSAFKMKVDAEDRPVNENLPEFVSYASKAWGQKMEVEDLGKLVLD